MLTVNLFQLIQGPNHITVSSETLIDHIFADSFFNNSCSGTFDLTTSDHKALYVIKHYKVPKLQPRIISVRDYSGMDSEVACDDLHTRDWKKVVGSRDVNVIYNNFQSELTTVLDKYAALKTRRAKGGNVPRMTPEVLDLTHQRDARGKIYYKNKKGLKIFLIDLKITFNVESILQSVGFIKIFVVKQQHLQKFGEFLESYQINNGKGLI